MEVREAKTLAEGHLASKEPKKVCNAGLVPFQARSTMPAPASPSKCSYSHSHSVIDAANTH